MLLQMALFHSFLWLSSIPLYICTISSLSIHLSMDIQVVSMSKAALLFLDCSSLGSAFPPFPDQQLNLPCGTQEKSRRLNEAYFLQTRNGGHRKDLYLGAPQCPARFQHPDCSFMGDPKQQSPTQVVPEFLTNRN